jgi:glutamine synthetase
MTSGSEKTPGLAELITFVTTDFCGITRGRAITRVEYEKSPNKTLGWTPANISLTPFDMIASPNPWGSRGDLRLVPDRKARFRAAIPGAATPTDFVMSDIVELDGTPWCCCPRSFLKRALADFHSETGLRLIASFEQEFQIFDAKWLAAPAFAYQGLRRADPFGPAVMAALQEAGVEPEVFLSEYGKDQFEITPAPADALQAADRAVAVREIIRETAMRQGWRASFAPKTDPSGVGNGVHIHMSFLTADLTPAAFDASKPGRLSSEAASFAAGILRHLQALVALTAPSPVSYLRLKPHMWSASYTQLSERDREASLRICPTHDLNGADPAKQFNLEYRAADAAASPHLALGAIIRAGLEGMRSALAAPPIIEADASTLSDAARRKLGLKRLPETLPEALKALAADRTVKGWFAKAAFETYTGMKAAELGLVKGLKPDALCNRYATIY